MITGAVKLVQYTALSGLAELATRLSPTLSRHLSRHYLIVMKNYTENYTIALERRSPK